MALRFPTRRELERNPFGKAFVTLGDVSAAGIPTRAGDAARARLQARLEANRARGGVPAQAARAARVLIPETRTEAGVALALTAVPFGGFGTRTVGKVAVRQVGRAGARELAGVTAERQVARQASRQVAPLRQAARQAPAARENLLKRVFFGTPRRAALTGAGAGVAGVALLRPFGPTSTLPARPRGSRDGGGPSASDQADDSTPAPSSAESEGSGGPGFVTDTGLGNITAGIGSFFDRIGAGIADTLTGLGVPIGEGAGKAIAIGGTAVLLAVAGARLLKARRPKSQSFKTRSSSTTSSPRGSRRGARGRFVKRGTAV